MKKIVFITPPDAAYGFSLSGIIQYTVDMQDVEKTLEAITHDPETGLVIIDERLAMGIATEQLREIEHRWHDGLLLVLPSPEKPAEEVEDYATRLIRRAIGYHVRLKL